METLEAIKTRRSVRVWQDRPVPDHVVKDILEAALCTPSAGNKQPWQLVVINKKALLKQVPEINPQAEMARKAPLGLVVCGDMRFEDPDGFWVQDCAALTQVALLAAHASGLGGLWTGIHPIKERVVGFRRLLGLPQHIVPLSLVLLGYSDRKPEVRSQLRDAVVHYNRWK